MNPIMNTYVVTLDNVSAPTVPLSVIALRSPMLQYDAPCPASDTDLMTLHSLLFSVDEAKERVSAYVVVLDTTLTVPLTLCPLFVATIVYVPVSVTVNTAVPVLVFVWTVVPSFFNATDAPESTVTVIVALKNVRDTA